MQYGGKSGENTFDFLCAVCYTMSTKSKDIRQSALPEKRKGERNEKKF
jgi:hypothetical protein